MLRGSAAIQELLISESSFLYFSIGLDTELQQCYTAALYMFYAFFKERFL